VNGGRAFFLFNREEIAYAPLVMNSTANNTFAYFGFNDEPAVNPDVALLAAAAVTVSNKVVVSDNLSSGTSTLGGSTAEASLFLGDITLNRDVQLTAAAGGTATFSGAFSGTGSIIKTGAGTVVLAAAPASTGRFTVREGTLAIQGHHTLTNELTIAANPDNAGMLAVGGSLTLDPGAQLTLSVTGTLDITRPYYTLVTWTTARTGSFTPVVGVPDDWRVEYRSNSLILFPLRGTMIQIL
jgi:autotransporter-associated beta strand protein